MPALAAALAVCWVLWSATGAGAAVQEGTPPPAGPASPSPSPSPPAEPLQLDIDRHVDRVLLSHAADGTLRFETTIEVVGRTPEELLARFLTSEGIRAEAARPGGAPSLAEMGNYRPHPSRPTGGSPGYTTTPSAALVPLVGLLAKALRKEGAKEARLFLYEARTPTGTWPVLRESRLPPEALAAAPGVSYTLVGEFTDWASAEAAYREWRAGRSAAPPGESIPTRDATASPPPP